MALHNLALSLLYFKKHALEKESHLSSTTDCKSRRLWLSTNVGASSPCSVCGAETTTMLQTRTTELWITSAATHLSATLPGWTGNKTISYITHGDHSLPWDTQITIKPGKLKSRTKGLRKMLTLWDWITVTKKSSKTRYHVRGMVFNRRGKCTGFGEWHCHWETLDLSSKLPTSQSPS